MSNFLKLHLYENDEIIIMNIDSIVSLQWWVDKAGVGRTILQTERRNHEVVEKPEAILEMIGAIRGN